MNKEELEKSVFESNYYESFRCPVCDSGYNHIIETAINIGGIVYIFDSNGMEIEECEPTLRGVSIFLRLKCEPGHYWTLQIQFHKGEVFYTTYNHDSNNTEDLWKD